MKKRWAVCPGLGKSDSWRTIWRIPGAEDELYVVRGEDQRGCEDPLDPAEAYPVVERCAADRNARTQLFDLYGFLRAPRLPPGLPEAVIKQTVQPRLHEAFKRGELLLIRIPPQGIGAGAINALLAPAPERLPPEKKTKEEVEHLLLQILRVDDHFVPKTEKLDIVYELEGFSGKSVRLDIESKHYGLVFSKDLEAPEKTDGTHTFYWDGKRTSPADRYAHPLLSPFRVHLYYDSTYTDERNFKILYHSIVLKNGPWTPDEKEPPESDEQLWAAYRLNQLGYYGGPVGTDLDDYLKKAIIRYKANHKKLREKFYPDYDDTVSPALKAALKAKENDRKFPVPAATEDPGAKSVLNVEALTYERTAEGTDEFGDKRSPYEKDRLNRPLVPIEVEIWMKKKDNSKVFQPEAVGPCRIDWRFTDADEDLAPQYAKTASEPSMTKTFIEKSLKLKSGRSGSNGDNCPADYAGVREDPATNWRTPFQTGDSYVPYSVAEDGGNKVSYTIACEDKAQYPKRQGKAGVFFRPSYIAADDYKLSAEIDFTGQPNKEELEKLHGITSPAKKIKAHTGTYTVRRFGKVAMSIEWPARKNAYEWDKIATEFGKAFNDVDTKGVVTKKIGQVLTEQQYKDIVTANTAHTDPSKIGYYADYLVGVKLPKQGNLDADDYKTALKTFTSDDYNDKIQTPLGAQISENVRKDRATGFIVVSFLLHKPVNIKNDPANGDNKVTKTNAGFVTWGGSIGLADSVILADQKDPDKVYYVVSHEMGHNFYLLHWENTGENNLSDHDQDDHNCTMSYSDSDFADPGHYAFQEPGKYTPHFCGKCNLALRGWDVVAGGMAVKATKGTKKGALQVIVKDPLDKAVKGAEVELVGSAKKPKTNGSGKVTFSDLDANTYDVKVRKKGYGPLPVGTAEFVPGDASGSSPVELKKTAKLTVKIVTPTDLALTDTPDDPKNKERIYKVDKADTSVEHKITATLKCPQKKGKGAGTQYPVQVFWSVEADAGNAPKAKGGKDNTDIHFVAAAGYAITGDGKMSAVSKTDDSGKTEIKLSASHIAGDRFRVRARVLVDPTKPPGDAILDQQSKWFRVWRKLEYNSIYRMVTGANKGVDMAKLCTKANIQPAYTPAFTEYTAGAVNNIAYQEFVADLLAPTAAQLPKNGVVTVVSDGADTRKVTITGLVVAADGSTSNDHEDVTLNGATAVAGLKSFQKVTGARMSAVDANRKVDLTDGATPIGSVPKGSAAVALNYLFDTMAAVRPKAQAWADANMAHVNTKLAALKTAIGAVGFHLVGMAYLHPKEDGRPATGKTTYYAGYPGLQVTIDGRQYPADGDWDGTDGINSGQMSCLFLNVAKTHPIGSDYTKAVARHEIGHASDHVSFGPGDHCPQPPAVCLMNATATASTFCDAGGDKSLHRAMGWKP